MPDGLNDDASASDQPELASLTARLQQLEARIQSEGAAAVRERPRRAPRPVTPLPHTPSDDDDAEVPEVEVPVATVEPLRPARRTGRAPHPVPAAEEPIRLVAVPALPEPLAALAVGPAPAALPPPAPPAAVEAPAVLRPAPSAPALTAVAPVVPAPRQPDPVVRVALALALLFLAAAAGMGTAALLENGKATWQSVAVVRVSPGSAPTVTSQGSLAAGTRRYAQQASDAAFTTTAAEQAGLAASRVRAGITTVQITPQLVDLTVSAATAQDSATLAAGAASAFVQLVDSDQTATVSTPGDRLTAAVVAPYTSTTQTSPRRRDALLAGGLAGAVVLLVGAGAFWLRGRRA